jgi:hypothetical protein
MRGFDPVAIAERMARDHRRRYGVAVAPPNAFERRADYLSFAQIEHAFLAGRLA